jgi:hypothetical protein
MKRNPISGLISQLNRIKVDLDTFANPESRTEFLRNLDGLIAQLNALREQLVKAPLEKNLAEVATPLARVIEFLQLSKNDQTLALLISDALHTRPLKPQRIPIDIPANLTNDQIRELLSRKLSKGELKAIAVQRGISSGKRSDDEVRRDILRSLERQEGYERLATPRA